MDQIAACTGPELNRIHQPCTDSHWLTWPAAMGLVDPPLLRTGHVSDLRLPQLCSPGALEWITFPVARVSRMIFAPLTTVNSGPIAHT